MASGVPHLTESSSSELSDFYDTETSELMTRAVRLIPCLHHLNEDTVLRRIQNHQPCPFDSIPIQRYEPDEEIRALAARMATPPTFSSPPPLPSQSSPSLLSSDPAAPSEKGKYIKLLKVLLEKPEIISNPALYSLFAGQGEELIEREDASLTPIEKKCYQWAQQLFEDDKIQTFVRDKILRDFVPKKVASAPPSISPTLADDTSVTPQQRFLKAIEREPLNPQAYTDLAGTLLAGESIRLLDGTVMTQSQLYRESITLDPNYAPAYRDFGRTLTQGKSAHLPSGTEMTQQQLYLRAVDLDPHDSLAHCYLAETLLGGLSISLANGKALTQQPLYLEAIALNPRNAQAYRGLAAILTNGKSITLPDRTEITQQGLYIKAIELDPNHAEDYLNLAQTLPIPPRKDWSVETVRLNGTVYNHQQLYLKAVLLGVKDRSAYEKLEDALSERESLRLPDGTMMPKEQLTWLLHYILDDPEDARGYYGLAGTLALGGSVCLPGGTRMTKQDLLLKVIALDPEHARAYHDLAFLLPPPKGIVCLPDGTFKNKQELYLKAIELGQDDAPTYSNLGRTLGKDESITLPDGSVLTKQQLLYLEAIAFDPKNLSAYSTLADALLPSGKIRLPGGVTVTREQLVYLIDIARNPQDAQALINLALTLPTEGTVRLIDGTVRNKTELVYTAINLDPTIPQAYRLLAEIVPKGQLYLWGDSEGSPMQEELLYLEEIVRDPKNAQAYANLALQLPPGRKIRLPDRTLLNQQQLLLKAVDLDPNNSQLFLHLAATLSAGETVRLPASSMSLVMNQQQLFLKAIALNPKNAQAYSALAFTLPTGGSIRLQDGTLQTQQELCLKAIVLDPEDTAAYAGLVLQLQGPGNFPLPNGTVLTARQICSKVITKEPNHERSTRAYSILGFLFSKEEELHFPDGTLMTKQQLLLKAMERNSLDALALAYHGLALTIPAESQLKLPQWGVFTQQGLFLRAVEIGPKHASFYRDLALIIPPEGVRVYFGPENDESVRVLVTKEVCRCLEAIALNPDHAKPYSQLGYMDFTRFGQPRSAHIRLPGGARMNNQELCLKAIALDPNDTLAYAGLVLTLPEEDRYPRQPDRTVQLLDGTVMTKQQLCLRAIALNPNISPLVYVTLANISPQETSSQLLSKQQLYIKAIALDPTCVEAYRGLEEAIPFEGESGVRLLDGTELKNGRQIRFLVYFNDERVNPWAHGSNAYELAETLPQGGSIRLINGKVMTKTQLYVLAIAPCQTKAEMIYSQKYYGALANALSPGETVQLQDGTTLSKEQLSYLVDIQRYQRQAHEPNLVSYEERYKLAETLPQGGSIRLIDGTVVTQQQLYVLAIAYGESFGPSSSSKASYYRALANTLSPGQSIRLHRGHSMTKEQLEAKASFCRD